MIVTLAELIKRHWGIVIILAAFVALGVAYSVVTPLFEAPDEIQHYFFVKHLADGKGLPVQGGESEGLWKQEGSQPPLYYALGALATFWINTDDAEELLWRNPQANMGHPARPGNKNVLVHTERESFPYRGATLAVHLVRLLSVLMGTGTVLVTYLIVLEIFPPRRALALGAAALNAFIPQFLFIAGSVNNDNAAAFFCSLALFLLIRLLRDSRFAIRDWPLLGFVLGLAALSKLSALGLFPLAAIAVTVAAYRCRSLGPFARGFAVALVVALLVAGWWYARNWVLYGDPTGLRAMLAVVGRRRELPASLADLWGEFRGLRMSFWALFGWFSIPVALPIYKALDTMTLLALAGLALWFARRAKRLSFPTLALATLALWVGIVLAGLAHWTTLTPGTQGRLLFPAISAISVLLTVGLGELVPRRHAGALLTALGTLMFAFAALCPFLYIAPAYARPPVVSPDDIPAGVGRLDVNFGGRMRLLGCELDNPRPPRVGYGPGETVAVTFYWQALADMERDYYVFIHLLGREGELVGGVDSYHGFGAYPSSLWRVGEVRRDTYLVRIEEDARAPTLCRIDVGLYDPSTGRKLPALDAQSRPLGSVIAGQFKIAPREPREYVIQNAVHFELADQVALVGYDAEGAPLRPGRELRLTLYWQALAEMDRDYTVFTHLVDAGGRIWAQHDGQPVGGDYPTSLWSVGEVVADEHVLVVKRDAPPGEYRLLVGMYELATGERLPAFDESGRRLSGDAIPLEPVAVVR